MKIRTAKAGDEKAIAGVIISTWKVAYRGIVPDDFLESLTTKKHEELFKDNIANKTETIFVLENQEKQIVGMVSGGQDRSGIYDCEIVAIYILPKYQRMGYGKCLFRELINDHKNNHYKSMVIWTFSDNKAKKFYENLGGSVKEKKRKAVTWAITRLL